MNFNPEQLEKIRKRVEESRLKVLEKKAEFLLAQEQANVKNSCNDNLLPHPDLSNLIPTFFSIFDFVGLRVGCFVV